jgi:hypothetical protein
MRRKYESTISFYLLTQPPRTVTVIKVADDVVNLPGRAAHGTAARDPPQGTP